MNARVDAAADAVYGQNHGWQFNMTEAESVAEAALNAADQIMFSDAAIERAAEAVAGDFPWYTNYRPEVVQAHVRAVIKALREVA